MREVWIVLDCDGYESSDFIGAFSTPEKAQSVADMHAENHRSWYAKHMGRDWPGSCPVERIEMDAYEIKPWMKLP